jgi:preprotein translocase subunit SecE
MGFDIKKFFNYLGDVKQEVNKVTWPSKQEVIITTIVVLALACICAIFFAVVDTIWYRTVRYLIGG